VQLRVNPWAVAGRLSKSSVHAGKQWVEFLETKVYDGCAFDGSFELTHHSLEQRRWFGKRKEN
jgi:hypothetical protein